jgi:hypothetical protein
MSTVAKETSVGTVPPDEKFWQRYSAHHEFPLAGMTSFFIHALVIGVMALAGFWYLFQRESESNKPPTMDMVQLAGGGDGDEGAAGTPGLPGNPGPKEMETVLNPATGAVEPVPEAILKDAPKLELAVPEVDLTESKSDLESMLSKLEKDAAEQAKKTVKKESSPAKKQPSPSTVKGGGGEGGTGGAGGKGTKGIGTGAGGPGGRKATKAEIYAMRWRFNLGRNAKEHVDQLKAVGLVVVFRSPQGVDYFVNDLNRRPVALKRGNIAQFKDAVQWENTSMTSLVDLATELRLEFVPTKVLLFLPMEREEKIAAEEYRFADANKNKVQNIKETHFEFRLRDGVYEPVAVFQVGFDGRIFKKL